MKPTWSKFLAEYPNYVSFPDSAAVKKSIGGEVDAAWIVNTCAVRMSRGLNGSGVVVPGKFAGMVTLKGGDGKRYAIRVAEVRKWLPSALGKPDFDLTKKAGVAFDQGTLAAFKGIVAFDIHFKDATGHLDAWDGKFFSHEYASVDYWNRASRVTLWNLA